MKILLVFGILIAATFSTAYSSKVVCYYASWSVYRPDPFRIEHIDPSLCTHVIYSFVGLDANGYVKVLDPWNDVGDEWHEGGFAKFQKLKKLNPSIKLLVSVGGWNEGATKFQSMVRNPQKRKAFVDSALDFLRKYRFDGLEIAWVYQDSFGGTPEDKAGYSQLVKEMYPRFKEDKFILCAATSAHRVVFTNSYDISVLSNNLDFINIMSYDLHGFWDGKTGHVAPLYPAKDENEIERLINVEEVVKMYISNGASPEKLNVGTVSYGRTFVLVYPTNHGLNSPSKGAGPEEPLPYNSFCRLELMGVWKKYRSTEQAIPYAVRDAIWVGYEDPISLRAKAAFTKFRKLGGVTFWSLDYDDFNGVCNSGKFPLLKALKEELSKP